jgi:hypothetical protein
LETIGLRNRGMEGGGRTGGRERGIILAQKNTILERCLKSFVREWFAYYRFDPVTGLQRIQSP